MLLNDFYVTKETRTKGDNSFEAQVSINPDHKIFDGHFPGNPVVPGVCLIQMLKELVDQITKKELLLREADNIKFLSVINPKINPVLNFNMQLKPVEGGIQVKNVTTFADTICFKFGGRFK